jgi:hypothetical protein
LARAADAGYHPAVEDEGHPGCADAASVRDNLVHHAERQGLSLAALSKAARKNAAYLQQFVERGSPKVLPDEVRLRLAMTLNIDERLLGAREPWSPSKPGSGG